HGEEFMEKGHWGHNAGFHEEQIHVPMVLHIPGRAPQACLRPRDRFWDIPVPKIDSAFDNLFVPQPSWSPSTTQQLRKLVAAPYLAPNDWTPRSEAYFVFPLAQGTPGKQCGLAATGDYQPSLRSPWLAAEEIPWLTSHMDIIPTLMPLLGVKNPVADYAVSAQESTPVFPT
ncbi:hypothetical protein, partial [Thiolapillus sp.]|uniref:hypothetical protein n=1 Tax=Thiolapillus sp. TaxID=2017437 RepID=UPI003AF4824C